MAEEDSLELNTTPSRLLFASSLLFMSFPILAAVPVSDESFQKPLLLSLWTLQFLFTFAVTSFAFLWRHKNEIKSRVSIAFLDYHFLSILIPVLVTLEHGFDECFNHFWYRSSYFRKFVLYRLFFSFLFLESLLLFFHMSFSFSFSSFSDCFR
jgi:hypothetical protein